jgi:hypothetical protein
MWLVLLKSAKDCFIGVNSLEQPVPPHVRYGTTCLLIRNTIGSVSCSDEWGMAWYFTWDTHGAREACGQNRSKT